MVTQLTFHSWGIWHSKPGNQGFRRTVGETGGSGWGECVCRQVRELHPKDLQDGHWGGPLSLRSPPGLGACTNTGTSCAEEVFAS